MGAFRSSSGLLLSVAGIAHANFSFFPLISGPGFLTTGESIASTPSNSFQESCQGGYLQNNSQSITASVDIFLGELLCKNDGLPQNVSVEVEQNLKLIVELSLKVYLKLVNNGTGVLEAFGVLNSLNLGNLSDPTFVQLWFSLKMAPFLPYISQSFLIQLGNENFSCSSFQKLIVAFSIERWFIQSKQQQAVYTHFIKSFLSRKDLPDPGCVSSVNDSQQWLQANFGSFSSFATIQDLQVFNPNFSINVTLSQLAPSQVAELLLSSNITVDVNLINQVFERLAAGNALENVDEFLTKLTTEGQVPQFQPVVRDRMMNRTFDIISPHFISFQRKDYSLWFRVKLLPILASFTPEMLQNVTSTINCTNYQIIVSGMADVSSAMPQYRQQEIAAVLLSYMTKSVNIINQPGRSDALKVIICCTA
ncbi:putative LOC107373021-like protein [Nothobranchius furzeri]|uniref:LOC107373021-like protein n=1 Tax=Nothobranchius furzeri TaxID=105023 RepID=A0A9D2XHZ9_NOTFU|nr:putative LOC107373021-like protein [Nothobranchius furzeri]